MRLRIFLSTALLLMLNAAMLFAQTSGEGGEGGEGGAGGPCGFKDDDSHNCPLDTWVIVLALVVIIFAAVHLHKKQKRAALQIQG